MDDIRSILLHVDATPSSAGRLEFALELAARHDAEVTAVFAAAWQPDRASFAYSASAALDAFALDPARAAHEHARDALRGHRAFEGPRVHWCEIVADSVVHGFGEEAAYADLLVVGQQTRVAEAGSAPPGFVEATILESGKPTLVVPIALRASGIGRRALVAWDGSARAARALSGALPLLRKAEQVHVVSWARQMPMARFSRTGVADFLARHGIAAETELHGASSHIAAEIAACVARFGADLVVMGCYGHSRASERVFGGATRAVLASATVPVLMAH